jgi:predicted metal-binding protein
MDTNVLLSKAKELGLKCGFTQTSELDPATIRVRYEVREACATNKCGRYEKCWSCPPGCGSLEECGENIRRYKTGVLLQTTGQMEDSFDVEGLEAVSTRHAEALKAFLPEAHKLSEGALILGAGSCTRCETCTYPDSPCRFPKEMTSSMEAYGMVVSDVCTANNLPYYYGPNTMTYTACALFL